MARRLCVRLCLSLISAALPLRAANRPHQGAESQETPVWTNDEVENLHVLGLISIVGRMDAETPTWVSAPEASRAENREWYAVQARKLHLELEHRRTELSDYRQAIEDARTLAKTEGGLNLDADDIGITPESAVQILERRVNEAQTEIDALEDMARRHDIPQGLLRGR